MILQFIETETIQSVTDRWQDRVETHTWSEMELSIRGYITKVRVPALFQLLSILVIGDSEDDTQQSGEDDGCDGPTDPVKVELARRLRVRTG